MPVLDGFVNSSTTEMLAPGLSDPDRLMNELPAGAVHAVTPFALNRLAFELNPASTTEIGPWMAVPPVLLSESV
jgi:hypothetical protein